MKFSKRKENKKMSANYQILMKRINGLIRPKGVSALKFFNLVFEHVPDHFYK